MKTVLKLGALCIVLCLFSTFGSQQASAYKIIKTPSSIEPLAGLGPKGRQVVVALGCPATEWTPGLTAQTEVVVFQEATGARAVGHYESAVVEGTSEQTTVLVRCNAVAGSPAFREGFAVARYSVVVRQNGRVVNTWWRQVVVYLLTEE